MTIKDIMKQCECSRSTVKRDLVFLKERFPIESIPGRYGGVKLMDDYHPHSKELSPEEIVALIRACKEVKSEKEKSVLGGILMKFQPRLITEF